MTVSVLTPLKETMHAISSGLLMPTIIVLLFFVAWMVVELGSLLVEAFTERRKVKINVPELLDAFQGKGATRLAVYASCWLSIFIFCLGILPRQI